MNLQKVKIDPQAAKGIAILLAVILGAWILWQPLKNILEFLNLRDTPEEKVDTKAKVDAKKKGVKIDAKALKESNAKTYGKVGLLSEDREKVYFLILAGKQYPFDHPERAVAGVNQFKAYADYIAINDLFIKRQGMSLIAFLDSWMDDKQSYTTIINKIANLKKFSK